ncbi:hypothetical protein LguiB_021330 [Lonicera macranthoides]
MEFYADEMLLKSKLDADHIRDLRNTFNILIEALSNEAKCCKVYLRCQLGQVSGVHCK